MATLNLTTSHRTAVWRLLRAALQDDTVYASAGIDLRFLDGDFEAVADLDTYRAVVQFVGSSGTASWLTESSSGASLIVQVRATIASQDIEDVFDLQHALESSLNSLGDLDLQADLVAAGAWTGLILFNQPLRIVPGSKGGPADDGLLRCQGQFEIQVRRPLID